MHFGLVKMTLMRQLLTHIDLPMRSCSNAVSTFDESSADVSINFRLCFSET